MKIKYYPLILMAIACEKLPVSKLEPVPSTEIEPTSTQTKPISAACLDEECKAWQKKREERLKPIAEENCKKAMLGLREHGGRVLFTNLNNKCYMMAALQVFFHSKPVFDTFCAADISKNIVKKLEEDFNSGEYKKVYKFGYVSMALYELFQEIFRPARDVSKVLNIAQTADILSSIMTQRSGKDWCSGEYQDVASFCLIS